MLTNFCSWRIFWTNKEYGNCSSLDIIENLNNNNLRNQISRPLDFPKLKEVNTGSFEKEVKEVKEDKFNFQSIGDLETETHFYQTATIPYTDPQLLKILCSLMMKIKHSNFEPTNLLENGKLYIELSKGDWSWVKFNNNDNNLNITKLNYSKIPSKSEKYFVLLYDMRYSESKKVWMACSRNGRVCVIKYFNPQFYHEEDIEREIFLWHFLFKRKARKITLNSEIKRVLVMPFLYTMNDYSHITKEMLELVEKEIEEIGMKNYYHQSLNWKRVGFYYNKKQNLKVNFIKLVYMKKIDNNNDIPFYINQMKKQLGLTGKKFEGMERDKI